MSNKYIEVVKKWLADNDSVSLEELEANATATDRAWFEAAEALNIAVVANEAAMAARNGRGAGEIRYWVKRYAVLTKESE